MLTWILALWDLYFQVFFLRSQKKETFVIQHPNASFSDNRCWVDKFFPRQPCSAIPYSILSQKLPKKLEGVLIKYYVDAPKLTRTGKHSFSLVGNMDKIQIFFDLTPWKCISTKDERVCGLFFFMEWKEYIWQFYCQPLQMDKCFHTWSFWGEKLTKLSVI